MFQFSPPVLMEGNQDLLPIARNAPLSWQELVRCSTNRARELIKYEVAARLCVLPLAIHEVANESFLAVLAGAPISPNLQGELQFIVGLPVTIEGCDAELIRRAVVGAYFGGLNHLAESLTKAVDELSLKNHSEVKEVRNNNAAPVPILLEAILHRASYLAASDIHLDALKGGIRVRFRVDGVLRDETGFTAAPGVGEEIIRRIKVLAEIKNLPDGIPQEGSFTFRDKDIEVRLRVSIIAQAMGCKVVLRVMERSNVKSTGKGHSYAELGVTNEQEQKIRAVLGATSGCILSVGPTGSGKSTLIYSMLEHLNDGSRHIVSIEDPVERTMLGVTQIEVTESHGFKELLAKILRQDPDVIVVGEIRERESAEAALSAGITGHLVISTLHAGNCIEAFIRLLNFGIDRALLFATLRLLISQRLIPKLCVSCAKQSKIDSVLAELFKIHPETTVLLPVGCKKCDGNGNVSRIGVFEIFPITENIKRFALSHIENDNNSCKEGFIEALKDAALEVGYSPIAVRVRELLINGTISPYWALKTVGIAPEMIDSRLCHTQGS